MVYEKRFTLSTAPPFRLGLTVWALRRRKKNTIDQWDEKYYSRVFVIDREIIRVLVEQNSENELEVFIESTSKKSVQEAVTRKLQKMLGIEKNLDTFYNLAAKDAYLHPLVKKFKGVKPPRFPTIFEALINAIACQQVTLDLGITLLNKLAKKYGRKFENMNTTQYAFPRPEDLYEVSEEGIKKLGFSYHKARTIIVLSKLLIDGQISFENMEALPNKEIVNRLIGIKGIGRWSAEYVLLRGFGRIDTFPGDDVGAQNNLMRIFALTAKPDYEEIKKLTAKWQPYAGLVYFHLLLDKLHQKQLL